MAEPADINVDELRRRARRRLVGAIVLALAAAVIVPMLLESDPKPLGDDVAVKIPAIDDSKFVNRLNEPPPTKSEPIREPRKDSGPQVEAAARKSVADAEKAVIAPPAKTPQYDTAISPERIASVPAPPVPPPAPVPADTTPPPPASAELKPTPAAPPA